ncbi:MAG: Antibiotic biosynthesis monooxygenase [Candidatus Parvarchaeum acidophilus ARMAN-5]|jgi:heme-degrading monooxygenase HmoA|uniref:Antibiotic biosynthesis monooxygenase n=1 Tax=Candidatus Parvarchaeum acidophilus ARMAN-5 TaxID=662762 RepID=D6GUA2_PARA5|nr:MAG: Antibiotic biosynthesis monooxygenase [Candidatus Parvarchaeum acidophilus ARMAN-5]EFD93158.1 MAG: Antibiotic biosynthesis monooxygenase [Candidatus Parvarchaeum acidophilus ARMAN-5]
MINIGLYYKVKEGHESEFEERFNAAVSAIKEAGFGCTDARLYKEVSNPSEYMLYTEWEDTDGFRKFMQSDAYKQTVEAGKEIIEGHPKHRIFTENTEQKM